MKTFFTIHCVLGSSTTTTLTTLTTTAILYLVSALHFEWLVCSWILNNNDNFFDNCSLWSSTTTTTTTTTTSTILYLVSALHFEWRAGVLFDPFLWKNFLLRSALNLKMLPKKVGPFYKHKNIFLVIKGSSLSAIHISTKSQLILIYLFKVTVTCWNSNSGAIQITLDTLLTLFRPSVSYYLNWP